MHKYIWSDRFIESALSSRYTDCSEAKQMLEVLINKAVHEEEFLPFAACLIKLIFSKCGEMRLLIALYLVTLYLSYCLITLFFLEQCVVDFKKYFPDLIDAKRIEVIRVSNS